MAPHADEEIHGDQHCFPEEKEQEEIEGNEDANHPGFESQQKQVKFLDAMMRAMPRGEHADGGEEGGEDNQEHADAVHAKVIIDGRSGDPMAKLHQRVAWGADRNAAQQEQRENKFDHRHDKREAANPEMVVTAQQEKRSSPKTREEDQHGKEMAAEFH